MAREMTPQERAAAIVDKVKSALTPIWLGGRQRMLLEQEIAEALTATRRAALLEAVNIAKGYAEAAKVLDVEGPYSYRTSKRKTSECIAAAIERLAQEGA